MPPLLDDFIHNRVCKLKCEKFLTRPGLEDLFYIRTLTNSGQSVHISIQILNVTASNA